MPDMCKAYLCKNTSEYYLERLGSTEAAHTSKPHLYPRDLERMVTPTDLAIILKAAPETGAPELSRARWWFVSRKHALPFAQRPKVSAINVKAEVISSSQKFSGAFADRRCLVPADAWFAWGSKNPGGWMWEFAPKGGGPLFFAGIWEQFVDPALGTTDTFAIVTEPAGSPLNRYNDRAPVVLWGADRQTWLDRRAPPGELKALLGPESPDGFDMRRVERPRFTNYGKIAPTKAARGNFWSKNNPAYQIARLERVAEKLEKAGRVLEAACYRDDAEAIRSRTGSVK
jgi:putative SOS response-associated peptidase YedK